MKIPSYARIGAAALFVLIGGCQAAPITKQDSVTSINSTPPASSPDRDLDGIPDSVDLCPNISAGLFPDPDRKGCPVVRRAPARIAFITYTPGRIVTLKPVFFAVDQDTILPESIPTLQYIADEIKRTPEFHFNLEGSCDETEKDAAALSERRARYVENFLLSQGIDSRRLTITSRTAGLPETNNTAAARAENRRVAFIINNVPVGGSVPVPTASTNTAIPTMPAIRVMPSIDTAQCGRGVAYSREARELRIQGDVSLRVAIDERGKVGDVMVIDGLGHGLDEAAVNAIKSASCRFTPAIANDGRPVPFIIPRYSFHFELP